MAVKIVDDPIKEFAFDQVTCVANDANGATSGRRAINLRAGYREITALASAEARLGFAAKITSVMFYDASANTWQDLLGEGKALTDQAQTAVAQIALASADYLYIATVDRVGGFRFTIDATTNNDAAATMAYQYSSSGSGGFTTTAITDGTNAATDTFEQTGNITIDTVPADGVWRPVVLADVLGLSSAVAASVPDSQVKRYWSRFQPSANLDATLITQIVTFVYNGAAANTANASGGGKVLQASTEYTIDINDDYVGSLEYRSNLTTGTPTIDIDWIKR